jgi:hypothetical protein
MRLLDQSRSGLHSLWELSISVIDHLAVYDVLLDLLAESANAQRVPAFRLSDEKRARLDDLPERHREGTLTDDEAAELDAYERFEQVVRVLKARVLPIPHHYGGGRHDADRYLVT